MIIWISWPFANDHLDKLTFWKWSLWARQIYLLKSFFLSQIQYLRSIPIWCSTYPLIQMTASVTCNVPTIYYHSVLSVCLWPPQHCFSFLWTTKGKSTLTLPWDVWTSWADGHILLHCVRKYYLFIFYHGQGIGYIFTHPSFFNLFNKFKLACEEPPFASGELPYLPFEVLHGLKGTPNLHARWSEVQALSE